MTRLFHLSIACVGGAYLREPFGFVVALPVETMLVEVADLILRTLEFDDDHMSDFFLANGPRGAKSPLLARCDHEDASDEDASVWQLPLSAVFPLAKHKKLYYFFDYGDSWKFQITKKGREASADARLTYPLIVEQHGVKPLQYG